MSVRAVLREIIPFGYSEAELNPADVFAAYTSAIDLIEGKPPTEDDPKLLDMSLKLFDNDGARRATIDTRAGTMMSAITLAATLVTGFGFTAFKDTSTLSGDAFWAMFVTLVVPLLYLTATVWLLFRIQGPVLRETPDPKDLLTQAEQAELAGQAAQAAHAAHAGQADPPSPYQRRLAVRMLRYTINNYRINNRVLSKLWMAQTCFRNALVVLVFGGIVTVALLTSPPPSASKLAQALARSGGCTDAPKLTRDAQGRWTGVCFVNGRTVNVVVDEEGRTSFPP